MGVFYRERQFCELFKSENNAFDINFHINSDGVTIFVCHSGNWDSQEGKKILDEFWKKFKLPVIGCEDNCKVLDYKDINDDVLISEYIFFMRYFNWKTNIDEYNSKFVTKAKDRTRKI